MWSASNVVSGANADDSGLAAICSCARRRSEAPSLRQPDLVFYAFRKARRSALTLAACVVHMPCGAPGYTLSVARGAIFAASFAVSAIGTI